MMKTRVVITVEIKPAIYLRGHLGAATRQTVEKFECDRLPL